MIIVKRDTEKGKKMKASERLAKATAEALNSSAYVAKVIRDAGENAEQVKDAMFTMLYTLAVMNDEELFREISDEMFEVVMKRIA